jgi:hypothetical protein
MDTRLPPKAALVDLLLTAGGHLPLREQIRGGRAAGMSWREVADAISALTPGYTVTGQSVLDWARKLGVHNNGAAA